MRHTYRCTILLMTVIYCWGHSIAQNVQVDVSACRRMYNILSTMKGGASKEQVSSMLDSVLQARSYQAMFRHYNRSWRPNHLPISVFKNMILSLGFQGVYSRGENQRADQMLPFWIRFYEDLTLFRQNVIQLETTDLKESIKRAVAYAKEWLPPSWDIPDFYMPIHPNGGSIAFSLETVQGYDFFQLPRDSAGAIELERLLVTIAHESHHLGMKTIYPAAMSPSDSVAYSFLSYFVAEGTATKFINNYPGGSVPVTDMSRDSSFDNAQIAQWWRKYAAEETSLFARFTATFEQAYSGALSRLELQSEMSQFWLSGYISPLYFVGSELFGAIYQGHGKQGSFTAICDLRQLFSLYNAAITAKPEVLGSCFVIPDSTVHHAIAIGMPKR